MNCSCYSQRVIEHAVHDLLVRAGIGWVAVEDFADTVDTSSGVVARPEALLDVLDGVKAETVDYSPLLARGNQQICERKGDILE